MKFCSSIDYDNSTYCILVGNYRYCYRPCQLIVCIPRVTIKVCYRLIVKCMTDVYVCGWCDQGSQICRLRFSLWIRVVLPSSVKLKRLCLFMCLSVNRLTAKVINQFHRNLAWWLEKSVGGDLIPDMDSRSRFHLPRRHCRMGHFRKFISTSRTVLLLILTSRFSQNSQK